MLIDILTDISVEIGKTANDGDKSARTYRINKAAEEIHEANDLEESLDEEIVNFNQESAQTIALPAYMFKVRGARYVDGRVPISIDDMRNRYNFSWYMENETWYIKPRAKGLSPLSRSIDNQSVLKLSVPIAETQEFSVTITGKTDNSNRRSESVIFPAGTLELSSIGNYVSVESITKSRITAYDVTIKDVEDNILGQILNSEYQSQYRLYQIMDEERGVTLPSNFSGTEILFKKKFQPFKNDGDCFLGTSRYDKAIFWKFMEHRTKTVEEAQAYQTKCNQVISQIYQNDSAGLRRKINFRPQPFFGLPYKWSQSEYR